MDSLILKFLAPVYPLCLVTNWVWVCSFAWPRVSEQSGGGGFCLACTPHKNARHISNATQPFNAGFEGENTYLADRQTFGQNSAPQNMSDT